MRIADVLRAKGSTVATVTELRASHRTGRVFDTARNPLAEGGNGIFGTGPDLYHGT